MNLLTKPQRWMCAVTSFAMALNLTVEELCQQIGHDGSQIVNEMAEPWNRRGFATEELIEAALALGYSATPVHVTPYIVEPAEYKPIPIFEDSESRFLRHLNTSLGVVEGQGRKHPHMVAYDHGRIYDCDKGIYPFSFDTCDQFTFHPMRLWRIDKHEQTDAGCESSRP
jgi:hypothetical protein